MIQTDVDIYIHTSGVDNNDEAVDYNDENLMMTMMLCFLLP